MKRILFIILLLSIFPIVSHSAIIFQDNFDACTTYCSPTSGNITPPSPSPWSQWYASGVDATYGGVTHKSGEITSPGHGGTGKSLKMWRASGVFGNYTGALHKAGGLGSGITHWYFSYWQKISPGFHYTGPAGSGFKMWRFKTTGQETGAHHEIYLNSYPYSNTWGIYDGLNWYYVIPWSQKNLIWDGNWHFIQFEIGLTTNVLRLWVDEALIYENTSLPWNAEGALLDLFHFSIGNTHTHAGDWQAGWEYMEFDDVIISTTYHGPDITPPYVDTFSPANGATGVSLATTSFSFHQKDSEDGVNIGSIAVNCPGFGEAKTCFDAVDPLTCTGSSPDYTVSYGGLSLLCLDAVSCAIDGGDLASPPNTMTTYNYSFTAADDTQAPVLNSYSPDNGVTVAVSANTITVEVEDNILVNDGNLQFTVNGADDYCANTNVECTWLASPTRLQAVFTYTGGVEDGPAVNWPFGTTINARIRAWDACTSSSDLDFSWSFSSSTAGGVSITPWPMRKLPD